MREYRIFLFVVVLILLVSQVCQAIDKTATGFYYPTGKADFRVSRSGFFGATNADGYRPMSVWHCGTDILGNLNDPVFAVCDGEVVKISKSGWSDSDKDPDNFAYIIRHILANGEKFIAIYGHLRRPWFFQEGDKVSAGQIVGYLGPWKYGVHLHYGVYQDRKDPYSGRFPDRGYGRLPNPRPEAEIVVGVKVYGNWFDPIVFIKKRSWQAGNKILFCMTDEKNDTALWTINPDGTGLRKWMDWSIHIFNRPVSFSPDGQKLIFEDSLRNQASAIYSLDLQDRRIRKLSPNQKEYEQECSYPQFSPDGRLIAFKHYWLRDITDFSATLVDGEIWIMNADGSAVQVIRDSWDLDMPVWSCDGKYLAFTTYTALVNYDAQTKKVKNVSGQREKDGPNQLRQRWSPNSDQIAFMSSDEAERLGTKNYWHDLYLIRADGKDKKMLTGDLKFIDDLDWSRDGREIVLLIYPIYTDPRKGGQLIVVNVENPRLRRTIFQTKNQVHWLMWNSFRR